MHSVDSSAKAIDLTRANVELNFPGDAAHEAYAEDAFKYLDAMGDQYDLIILDPPAFAKHKDALRQALKGYARLNAKAFSKIKPGGIPVHVQLFAGGKQGPFPYRCFYRRCAERTSRAYPSPVASTADHPVNIYHPEGEYLKGLVLYVE